MADDVSTTTRLSAAAIAFVAVMAIAFAAATEPSQDKQPFVAQIAQKEPMHRHLDDLLDIAAALEKGDYDKAADIADRHLGIGSTGGKPKGPASDMRDSQIMWEKGLEFRTAASRFAGHARIVKRNPAPEAKAALFDSFTRMIGICHDCHEANRSN